MKEPLPRRRPGLLPVARPAIGRSARCLLQRLLRSDDGSVLVLVALTASVAVAFAALAIDLGMLMTGREEAQRAADSAALAGASAFLETPSQYAVAPAKARAHDLLAANTIRARPIDASLVASSAYTDTLKEAIVQVVPNQYQVHVTVRREGIPLWFARLMGINDWGVSADATAEAADAGAADCVKPFAIPDAWSDADDDINLNRVWDSNESWTFGSSPGDYYQPMSTGGSGATGYGSDFRKDYVRDYGRPVKLKETDPNDPQLLDPSIFLPWRLNPDPNMAQCQLPAVGQQAPGAATYRQNICQCNMNPVLLGQPYQVQTGDMVGPTYQGVKELVDEDPNAVWDPTQQRVVNSLWGNNWRLSPRVIKVAVFDPAELNGSGMQTLVFNNIALFFLESQANPSQPVMGRFLYFAQGTPTSAPTTGSLVKRLRLVH